MKKDILELNKLIADLKIELYHLLLVKAEKTKNNLTNNEIDIAFKLAGDKDIQNLLKAKMQAKKKGAD